MDSKTKANRFWFAVALTVSFAILGFIGYASYLNVKADRLLDKISLPETERAERNAAVEPPAPSSGSGGAVPVPEAGKPAPSRRMPPLRQTGPSAKAADLPAKPTVILLLGIDKRERTRSLNTDVIMAVAFNPRARSAAVLSVPRDMRLHPPGLPARKANFYYPYFYNRHPASALHKTKQVFSDLLGVPIPYAAVFDFKGFEQAVDALGGLTVDVDMDMRYVDRAGGTDINLKKGRQKLSGKQTLDFIRYRKSNFHTAESSDSARNRRQQQVLQRIAERLKSVYGLIKLGEVMDAIGDHLRTDLPEDELRRLLNAARHIDRERIRFIVLQGEWRSPYIHVKPETLQEARRALQRELARTEQDREPERPPSALD